MTEQEAFKHLLSEGLQEISETAENKMEKQKEIIKGDR